jgi:hypothetical protein
MSLAIWFWIFYVLGILVGGYVGYDVPAGTQRSRFWFGGTLVYAILFALLGLRAFGSPVSGH